MALCRFCSKPIPCEISCPSRQPQGVSLSYIGWPISQSRALVAAALRVIEVAHYTREDAPHLSAEREYAEELLAFRALELVQAVESLPADNQPVGWRNTHGQAHH